MFKTLEEAVGEIVEHFAQYEKLGAYVVKNGKDNYTTIYTLNVRPWKLSAKPSQGTVAVFATIR
jgi:hypothetical protein